MTLARIQLSMSTSPQHGMTAQSFVAEDRDSAAPRRGWRSHDTWDGFVYKVGFACSSYVGTRRAILREQEKIGSRPSSESWLTNSSRIPCSRWRRSQDSITLPITSIPPILSYHTLPLSMGFPPRRTIGAIRWSISKTKVMELLLRTLLAMDLQTDLST